MRNGRKHTVAISVGGVLGGLVGTAAIQKAMGLSQRLPEPLQMPETATDPGEYVVSRAEELAGGPLSRRTHARAVSALHWAYGVAWAGALAALSRRLKMHRAANAALAGAALGALNWAAGFTAGLLPAGGVPKPVRERPSRAVSSLLGHVLFGVVAAVPIYAAERLFVRRRGLRTAERLFVRRFRIFR
jgi:hypothetical protein